MNNTATIEKLTEMKFYGMARAFKETFSKGQEENFTLDEMIAHLVESEWEDRKNRKLTRLLSQAKFRYKANFEEIDFRAKRKLDKNLILRFRDCNFIKRAESIIITGPTGVGKSFIASAIGNQVCAYGYKVGYFNFIRLLDKMRLAQADGTYIKEMAKIEKSDLLILDDFGLKTLNGQQRLSFLEIIEDRHGKKSTIITSQLPVKSWYEIIGEPTLADAILDRITHSSHRIQLDGESLRKVLNNKFDEEKKC